MGPLAHLVGRDMSGVVSVQLDPAALARANEALQRLQGPAMVKALKAAAGSGARVLVAPMKRAAPVNRGHGGVGKPGDLRGSIRSGLTKKTKRGKAIVAFVGPVGKKATHRGMVIGGTKAHAITPRRYSRRGSSTSEAARRMVHRASSQSRPALLLPDGQFRYGVRHPGAKANPFVARVGAANRARVEAAMVRAILRHAQKAGAA